jgi:hypothetical protein
MMDRVGIFVHGRHLDTDGWEGLVFGRPELGQLGDQATLARVVLSLGPREVLACIVFGRGESWREGFNEAEYAKRYLLDNFGRLRDFPVLAPLLAHMDDVELAAFRRKLTAIIETEEVLNTADELEAAAEIFAEHGVDKVIQITAASHASRCIKEQAVIRARGKIDKRQLWFTVATDVSYDNTTPEDVCVIEPLHRPDQAITYLRPGLAEVIAPYFALSDDEKRTFIRMVDDFMTRESLGVVEAA